MEARGNDGTVRWDGTTLTIARESVSARIVAGGRGELRLTIGQITGVQIKKPGMTVGRFTVVAAGHAQHYRSARGFDPFTVRFYGKHLDEFEAIAAAVQQAASQPRTDTAEPGLAAELASLAGLHQSGALTDAEFAAAKAQLLGQSA